VSFTPRRGNEALLPFISSNPNQVTLGGIAALGRKIDGYLQVQRDVSSLEFPCFAFSRTLYELAGIAFSLTPVEAELTFWKAAEDSRLQPNVVEVLRWLSSQDVPMGVVSNCTFSGPVLEYELRKHNVLDFLKFVISSADYGIRKPHRLIFETAAAKIGADPSGIWFVGDFLKNDVIGSRACGMQPVWFNPKGAQAGTSEGGIEIRSYVELLRILTACCRPTP